MSAAAALPVDYKNLSQPITSADAPGVMTKWSHGKSRVRLMRVDRSDPKFDRVKEMTIEVFLESDAGATYVTGDNSRVVPTDTVKNTCYYVAKDHCTAKHSVEGTDHRQRTHSATARDGGGY
jgi:urate oxidase